MLYRVAILVAALALLPSGTDAQTPGNVLVVVNSNSPQSTRIAEHYATIRRIPARQVVRIETTDADVISRAEFDSTIAGPIAAWLGRHRLQDQILYLVLTKGLPLRIQGTGGLSGSTASVDSELTLLYRRMLGRPASIIGRLDNPYFLGDKPIAEARRFSRRTSDLYLVTRLDGFTVEDVVKLIDRGASPVTNGQILLDQRATMADRGGDAWLAAAAERLAAMNQGARVELEATRAIASATGPVLGYFSWGSNDPAATGKRPSLRFANGAIGAMFVGTSGRTFREPAQTGAAGAAGGPSLAGDLIRDGITGVAAHVSEPLLDAIVRPQILFPAYLSGFNLVESFYLSMPFLSWQDVVVGDPLCSPFASPAPSEPPIGIDPDTDLPELFAERRLAVMKSPKLDPAALKLFLKAQSFEAQGRPDEDVEAFLVSAAALEPRLVAAQVQLARFAESRGAIDEALTRYRAIIAEDPGHALALNNLAFGLADRKNAAKEALPLAERAYRLSGEAPAVADTLGWIHYKLGNASVALPYLDRAARLAPRDRDILIHAATVHASLNSLAQARIYLDAALKIDPTVKDREDVKALAAKIR